MAEVDSFVGSLLDAVDGTARNRTLTIFTSDNGPSTIDDPNYERVGPAITGSVGPFLGGGKYTIFEGGHRMPMLMHWPGTINTGSSSALTSVLDLMPTFATLVGSILPLGHAFEGADLMPILTGDEQRRLDHRLGLFLDEPHSRAPAVMIGRRYKMWVYAHWRKSITNKIEKKHEFTGDRHRYDKFRDGSDTFAVFDLVSDPAETNPLCIDLKKEENSKKNSKSLPVDVDMDSKELRWIQSISGEACSWKSDCQSWWTKNGCQVLRSIKDKIIHAAQCVEKYEHYTPQGKCDGNPLTCYPCCDAKKFDCRCEATPQRGSQTAKACTK